MHSVDKVPVLIFHVLETDIPEDTGVVEKDIDAAKVLDGGFNDGFAVLDTVVVCYCLAASSSDFIDNHIGSLEETPGVSGKRVCVSIDTTYLGRLALTRMRATQIVDNDVCTS